MIILGMDSSASTASVAITEDEKLLTEFTVNNMNTHSENLLPMVEKSLQMLNLKVEDIDAFAVSNGPGSFTGVRIGVSTIKGLAFNTQKPVIGVSTLEALAENMAHMEGFICPVMNARRQQVYTAIFESNGNKLTRITEDEAISIQELDVSLSKKVKPIWLVGDGYEICKEIMQTKTEDTPERLKYQSGYSICKTAFQMYQNGKYSNDREMKPVYLRASQAERERNEQLNKEKNNAN